MRRNEKDVAIKPREIDQYTGWDDDLPVGKMGIIVSDKAPGEFSDSERLVYELLAEGLCQEMGQFRESRKLALLCEVGDYKCQIDLDWHEDAAPVEAGETAQILEIHTVAPMPYREHQLVKDVLPLFDDCFIDDFGGKRRKDSKAI